MTMDKDFKRRIRERMAKTGESYATARSRLLNDPPDSLLPQSAWIRKLVSAWRRSLVAASPAVQAEQAGSLRNLAEPLQVRVYVRTSPTVPVEANVVVVRHDPSASDGDVRIIEVGDEGLAGQHDAIDSLALPWLEGSWQNMRANWSPARPAEPPLKAWQIPAQRLDSGGIDGAIWFVAGKLVDLDIGKWLSFTFREPTPAQEPRPRAPTGDEPRHLHKLGQDRERIAVIRHLGLNAGEFLARLGLIGPWWCALNVPRSAVFGGVDDGDVDLLAGPLEFNITPEEWKERVAREARDLPLTMQRDFVTRAAVERACDDGRIVWPPDMATVVACEAKASWFDPDTNTWKRTHAGEADEIKGQLGYLLKRGVDRVALLHVGATKPRTETPINLWFQASLDAHHAEDELEGLAPLLGRDDLPPCGYYRIVLGAVHVDTEERSGATGGLRVLRDAKPNPRRATAPTKWRGELARCLGALPPPKWPRVFVHVCEKCGRWLSSGLPDRRRCTCV